jgi:hypothetical protein
VEVHRDEGVAIRIGPEPCVVIREGAGEASAGERAGQPLSRERKGNRNADAVSQAEGNTSCRAIASGRPILRSQRTWHVRKLLVREPGGLPLGHLPIGVVRIGKARSRSR